MNSIKKKECSVCQKTFDCGDTIEGEACWCNDFPPIFNPFDITDCLCPTCFKIACSAKIDEFVATITPETAIAIRLRYYPKLPR